MSLEGRVLVVEDDAGQRRMLADFLRDLGLEVAEAAHGREGLDHFQQGSFDLVISDLRMPEMDGQELLREVKAVNPEVAAVN